MSKKNDLATFLTTKPEELASRQHDALRDFVVERLREIANLIKNGDYEKADKMLVNSPSGDGYGSDNEYIDFSDTGVGDDIGHIIAVLKGLHRQATGK